MPDLILKPLRWIGERLAAFWGGFLLGKEREKRKQIEKARDDANNQAEALSNRPRTLNDRLNRLRAWRNKY